LAYEQTGPARAAFEEISEFQWGDSTQFNLMTVVPNQVEFSDDAQFSMQKQREQAQNCIDDLRDEIKTTAPLSLGFILEGNHAGEAIVHFAESHGTDLMVVGESKQTDISRVLLGSVSRFVLRHAPCSVWITRNRNIKGVAKESASRAAHKTSTAAN
jgi:nucleotide-binding universal stress UspA family protein